MGAKSNILIQKLMPFVNKEGLDRTKKAIRYLSKKKVSEIQALTKSDIELVFSDMAIGRI